MSFTPSPATNSLNSLPPPSSRPKSSSIQKNLIYTSTRTSTKLSAKLTKRQERKIGLEWRDYRLEHNALGNFKTATEREKEKLKQTRQGSLEKLRQHHKMKNAMEGKERGEQVNLRASHHPCEDHLLTLTNRVDGGE